MNLKSTGNFIAQRRKNLGLTQEKLAQSMNITAKAISKWERGLSFPDVELLNNLAVVLKCEVSDLINGRFKNDNSSNIKPESDMFVFPDNGAEKDKSICFDYNSDKYVSPFLFGNNLEHTRNCIHSGLSAQMLENRKFAGKPGPKGCAHGWTAVGENVFMEFSESYTCHAEGYHMKRAMECNSQKIVSFEDGRSCGISQDGLHIEENRTYIFSIAVKSLCNCNLKISLSTPDGITLCSENISLEKSDDYIEKEAILSACNNCENSVLSITFDTANTLFIGAVSLMPADNFYGMRKDVIALMKEMGISILRWPGGNFAGEYNWKDGLLPSDKRAPLQSYLGLETQPHTMGYDFHEINTDDFVMLCREIGAEPFITINPTWNTPEESAQWVEYCNGDETTEYGKLRISRGFKDPYNVKFWSLGNEFGYGHMEGLNGPYEYSNAVRKHAEAMLRVSPYLALCSSGPYPNSAWVNHSAKPLSDIAEYVSLHHYVRNFPEFTNPATYKEEYENFINSASMYKKLSRCLRKDLDNDKIRISFDEWNSWYAWYRPESVCDGIFAAVVLHMFINEAEASGIDMVCHFEAVNEGAVTVDKKSAKLTPMGKAFTIMKHHKLGKLLFANDNIVTTENDGRIITTLINTSYDEDIEYEVPVCTNNASGTLYFSNSILPNTSFSEENISFIKEKDDYIIKMPPHSIALFIQE